MSVHPVLLEVFKNQFISIAEEMGVTLLRTAYSPNIKERKDFSCAVFDRHGDMVAQAAHIPVHLGAMPLSVKAAIKDLSFSELISHDLFSFVIFFQCNHLIGDICECSINIRPFQDGNDDKRSQIFTDPEE